MKISEFIKQMQGKEQRLQLLELLIFFILASLFFFIFNTNIWIFGIFISIGLVWLVYKTPDRKLCLITGLMGALIGNFTEAWGCPARIWNWTQPCVSIWMIFDPIYGYPIEVVIAYFAAGFWVGKVTVIFFEPQLEETIEFYKNKGYKENINIRLAVVIIIDTIGLLVFIIEPMYVQAMLLVMIGINIFLTLNKEAMLLVGPFAFFMGAAGFFFENFATGIIPGFSVWQYDLSLYNSLIIPDPVIGVAPISAFIAYMGTGFVLFSSAFALSKK